MSEKTISMVVRKTIEVQVIDDSLSYIQAVGEDGVPQRKAATSPASACKILLEFMGVEKKARKARTPKDPAKAGKK